MTAVAQTGVETIALTVGGLAAAGAYKTHVLSVNVELGPHDAVPQTLARHVSVEYTMNNSTVSHAQVRSVAVTPPQDEPPDRWVRHSARYEYAVEIEFVDRVRCKPDEAAAPYDEFGTAQPAARRSSRAASTERAAVAAGGGLGRPGVGGDRAASAPPITADDSSDEDSPPTDDNSD